MTRFNYFPWKKILLLALLLVIFSFLVFPLTPVAQANPFQQLVERVRLLINPPPRSTPTGRNRGGAGRGQFCPFIDVPVSAFVPVRQSDADGAIATEFVWGTTVEERPTFWFYVPYAPTEGLDTAKFVLLDADKNPVFSQPIFISLAGTPGIISFRLPEPYSLEVDKLYNWYFSIVCDAEKPSRNPGVRGWVQRVAASPELVADLNQAAPIQKYIAYAENGIWFEMVTDLAKNLDRNPANTTLQADWLAILAILKELNSTALQEAPIVECCTAKN